MDDVKASEVTEFNTVHDRMLYQALCELVNIRVAMTDMIALMRERPAVTSHSTSSAVPHTMDLRKPARSGR